VLSVPAAAFGAVARARGALYDARMLEIVRVDRPVVSVGNLRVGGSGKTPFTIMLAQRLTQAGLHVVVLSRGYGAVSPPDTSTITARRGSPCAPVEVSGDEPRLIALRTEASVIVGGDRVASARVAIDALAADVILLDDGFQHRRLARDLDLLLVDASRPFGNGRLLPAGPLREPVSAAARADLVVANHGADPGGPARAPTNAPVVEVAVQATGLVNAAGERRELDTLRGADVKLVAAIARPDRFEASVRGLGANVVDRAFTSDHRVIPVDHWAAPSALVLTTEKDLARGGVPAQAWALVIDTVVVRNEEALASALDEVLR